MSRSVIPEIGLDIIRNLVEATACIPGDMAELGVFAGGSAKIISQACPSKKLHLFDTFEGLPQDDVWDIGHKKGEFACAISDVQIYLDGQNVEFHPGFFPDTTQGLNHSYSFVHLDADLYESTKAGIEYFWPRLEEGGILMLDDYNNPTCPGVKKAVAEFIPGYKPREHKSNASFAAHVIKPNKNAVECISHFNRWRYAELATAAQVAPIQVDKYIWLGSAYMGLGKYAEARNVIRQGIVVFPDDNGLKLLLSYATNKLGKWREFYNFHEARLLVFGSKSYDEDKRWTGQSLQGKRICATTEQGAGDNIQFMRFLPLLKEQGAKVCVYCHIASLAQLFENQDYVDGVYTTGLPKRYDYHCPLLSIPAVMNLDFLPNKPYIKSDGSVKRKQFDKLNIGIAWAGNAAYPGDFWRSCPLKYFKKLDAPNHSLWSLQVDKRKRAYWNDPTPVDLSEHPDDMQIQDLELYLKDYLDTAAWIDSLDVVIAVDTATLHLAGGLGKKCIGLLPYNQCWRWPNEETTPWYPTMKLARQTSPGDWESALNKALSCIA